MGAQLCPIWVQSPHHGAVIKPSPEVFSSSFPLLGGLGVVGATRWRQGSVTKRLILRFLTPNPSVGQRGLNAQARSCSPGFSCPVLLQRCSPSNGALGLGCCPHPWKGQRGPDGVAMGCPDRGVGLSPSVQCGMRCGCGSPLRLGALLELWDAFGEPSVVAGLGGRLSSPAAPHRCPGPAVLRAEGVLFSASFVAAPEVTQQQSRSRDSAEPRRQISYCCFLPGSWREGQGRPLRPQNRVCVLGPCGRRAPAKPDCCNRTSAVLGWAHPGRHRSGGVAGNQLCSPPTRGTAAAMETSQCYRVGCVTRLGMHGPFLAAGCSSTGTPHPALRAERIPCSPHQILPCRKVLDTFQMSKATLKEAEAT